jgi:low temperature requirement protein LtrA
VTIQVSRSAFVIWVLARGHRLRLNFQRIIIWSVASGVLGLAGGLADGMARSLLWLAAVLVDYAAPIAGFWVPGFGRSETEDWDIAGGHLAERCKLFVIVAFGESILVTGATLSDLAYTPMTIAAFVVAFVGSVALWWIYFDRSAEYGSEIISETDDPGRIGRSAYTYFHLPMVAGIIVCAVADELTIAHPEAPGSAALTAATLGGPALFLLGHGLFKWALVGVFPTSRVIAIATLAVLTPVGLATPALVTGTAAMLVAVAVATWDTLQHRLPLRHDAASAS